MQSLDGKNTCYMSLPHVFYYSLALYCMHTYVRVCVCVCAHGDVLESATLLLKWRLMGAKRLHDSCSQLIKREQIARGLGTMATARLPISGTAHAPGCCFAVRAARAPVPRGRSPRSRSRAPHRFFFPISVPACDVTSSGRQTDRQTDTQSGEQGRPS